MPPLPIKSAMRYFESTNVPEVRAKLELELKAGAELDLSADSGPERIFVTAGTASSSSVNCPAADKMNVEEFDNFSLIFILVIDWLSKLILPCFCRYHFTLSERSFMTMFGSGNSSEKKLI